MSKIRRISLSCLLKMGGICLCEQSCFPPHSAQMSCARLLNIMRKSHPVKSWILSTAVYNYVMQIGRQFHIAVRRKRVTVPGCSGWLCSLVIIHINICPTLSRQLCWPWPFQRQQPCLMHCGWFAVSACQRPIEDDVSMFKISMLPSWAGILIDWLVE